MISSAWLPSCARRGFSICRPSRGALSHRTDEEPDETSASHPRSPQRRTTCAMPSCAVAAMSGLGIAVCVPSSVRGMPSRPAGWVCRMLKYGQGSVDKGAEYYRQGCRQRQIQLFGKKANAQPPNHPCPSLTRFLERRSQGTTPPPYSIASNSTKSARHLSTRTPFW